MNVLFLTRYSQRGGSSRYMVHQYLPAYAQAGMRCTVEPLFDDRYFEFGILDRPTGMGEIARHGLYYARRVARRLRALLNAHRYDLVVFEKELFPYLPYGFEEWLRRRGVRFIVLFDDATYAYYRQHPFPLVRWLCRGKIERIVRNATHVIAWNDHLAGYMRRLTPHVSVVNSGVDMTRYPPKDYRAPRASERLIIGWIGTPNGFPYLRSLETVFGELVRQYPLELHVISAAPYTSAHIPVVNHPWSLQTEVQLLHALDIGVMPLPDDEWTRGKSGVKAVQYMAVGVPAVCSPVGVARQLIVPNVNGVLADNPTAWRAALARLLDDPTLRERMGMAGRATVMQAYSIQSVAPTLVDILLRVGQRKDAP
ncbi:glycosyltransferase family 4 protein [Roseiflexus castenholzii]|jgi:glycosyltransferase involved in cell wall biosynthesis|uniref:Glycosyl transferase group 1 n=1 Tax=Roseiflexus castenholzii (strain DSM 13941 / HLO8) TaxID=383372 RepID=A7NIY5_ROSCS|nr:glycosyltransferase family 4 protein [Roseiflexus castenholzii]ABU57443.1 glycosyl transferase group 1 [Roseiflexus castenholzii DSM 13941]